MSDAIDRIAIYQKLISIKPFFEDVEKIKQRKKQSKEAFETSKEVTLVSSGGIWIDRIRGGSNQTPYRPIFFLY